MTKKDYEVIAGQFDLQLYYYRQPENSNIKGEAIEAFAKRLAERLELEDDPKFNKVKFLTACGIETEGQK